MTRGQATALTDPFRTVAGKIAKRFRQLVEVHIPNTLAHIAIQSGALGAFRVPFAAVLAGCLIPDLPWIPYSILWAGGADDLARELAYACVQASLVFCVVLSLGFSWLFDRWLPVAIVTSLGCALHLFVDALQDKWGNGVHLLAPFDWTHFSIGIWPIESTFTLLITLGGLLVILFVKRLKTDAAMICLTRRRAIGIAGTLAVYLVVPVAFVDDVIASNTFYLETMSDPSDRAGKYIEFDQNPVKVTGKNVAIVSHTGEVLTITNPPEGIHSGTYSFKGRFVSGDRIRISAWMAHSAWREFATYIGLAIIGAWFVAIVVLRLRTGTSKST